MSFAQGDPAHASTLLGWGPSTFHGAGCVLMCLVRAAHHLGTRPSLSPIDANKLLRDAGCFRRRRADGLLVTATRDDGGCLLHVPSAAAELGLSAPDKGVLRLGVHDAPTVRAGLARAVVPGVALLWVDHDSDTPLGDPEGDHYVLAFGWDRSGGVVLCDDPATGDVTRLAWPSLAAKNVRWGRKTKDYRSVLTVRPITRAPEAPQEQPAA